MKSGKVAVVGRSNAGKSTLVNVLVGEKVSIVSPKPQTTRDTILGIYNSDDYQIVFEDTPGFYRARNELNKRMQKYARQSTDDVDLILFVIDAHDKLVENDVELLKTCIGNTPLVVVVSKIDIMQKENLLSTLQILGSIEGVKEIVPVSSRKGKNIGEVLNVIKSYMTFDGKIIEDNIVSNKSERFMISEIMREKILLKYDKEIPHGVAIKINEFSKNDKGVYEVNLDIICEKPNHKAIIIGKGGSALKEVNSFARKDMEKFLDSKVFLTTYVKVIEDWRDKEEFLSQFGYENGKKS